MKMNYIYLLRCADNSLYCGWTTDPEARIAAHNSGKGAKYTRSRLPVRLVYTEAYGDRHEALSREWHIKRMSHEEKEKMIMAQETDYGMLVAQAGEMLKAEPWYVAAMSNISALVMENTADLNWAGFYLMREGRLVVGPFQGKPACIHIDPGKGVCGTAVEQDGTIVVPDVHEFPGHIACDGASESEIVIPLHGEGGIRAVLDIDSPKKNRFSLTDREGLEKLVQLIEQKICWEDKTRRQRK